MISRRVSGDGVRMRIQAHDGDGGAATVVSSKLRPCGRLAVHPLAGPDGGSSSLELESLDSELPASLDVSSATLPRRWSPVDPSSVDGCRESTRASDDPSFASSWARAKRLAACFMSPGTADAPCDVQCGGLP